MNKGVKRQKVSLITSDRHQMDQQETNSVKFKSNMLFEPQFVTIKYACYYTSVDNFGKATHDW